MKAHQAVFPVETMCKVLNISRSGYYYWLAQRPTKRAKENETILKLINTSFTGSKGRYGSPKITQDLVAQGVNVSRPRVARLMKKATLRSVVQKKYVVTTTDSKHNYPVAENHLNRQFNPVKPGQAWVSDLTARAAPLYLH
jgi:transposase InsO family protein